MEISQFNPSAMYLKLNWEVKGGFTHDLQRPGGFVIISATLTEVMTVTGLPVLVICSVVPKSARATLATNGRQRGRDGGGCNFRSWAQAGADPAVHGGICD